MSIVIDLYAEINSFLTALKKKKDNFKFKLETEGDRFIVWIKKEQDEIDEMKISYDASPEMMNVLDIRNDLLNVLFEL